MRTKVSELLGGGLERFVRVDEPLEMTPTG